MKYVFFSILPIQDYTLWCTEEDANIVLGMI